MNNVGKAVLSLLLLSLFLEQSAWARLGDYVSGASLRNATVRTAKAVANTSFRVMQSESNGVVIQEYVSQEGYVFALSWRGISNPNLSEILGSYFPEYDSSVQSEATKPRLARSRTIATSQMTVYHSGHMRDLRGLAVIPDLMPSTVSLGDLQ